MPGDDLEDLRITKDPRRPIGMGAWASTMVVVCDDGTAWMWSVPSRVREKFDEHQRFLAATDAAFLAAQYHEWVPFHQPIPGSPAWAEYADEQR